jgi:hypothetical protein
MLYGRIPGVHQPVSRLVMGVDNQEDRAQAAAVFDDFVLYLMHRDNTDVPVGEFVDAMEEQLAAGRVAGRAGSSPAGRTRTTTRTPSWSAAATATRTSAGWPAPSSSGRDWRYPPPPSLCPMCCISRSRRSR